MAQRISRAKATIRAAGASFERPADPARDPRLGSVQHVLYLIFNEGYLASSGSRIQRVELAEEAIRLTRLLLRVVPDDRETRGLVALMLLTHARRDARTTPDGALIPLSEPSHDVSFELPAAARVRLKQIKPKPYAVERSDALPALGRFLAATPEVELVWLTDGVDLGGGSDFVSALAQLVEQRPITVIEGGLATAHALSGAENAAVPLIDRYTRPRIYGHG